MVGFHAALVVSKTVVHSERTVVNLILQSL